MSVKTNPSRVTYEDAGVSIRTADKLIDFLRTKNSAIGGFSGLFPLKTTGMKKPMLVASTDGVGTKLLVAKLAGDVSTIGIDLVAMVINDLLCCGARPLFFLDYYATSRLELKESKQIVSGILKGCEIAGCPLIGGETAELPGLYQPGDFDLAGFGIGLVDGANVIDGKKVRAGDVVYGFESSGIHSNGYSLARHVLLENAGLDLKTRVKELNGILGKELLKPTKIYANLVAQLQRRKMNVKALAHITGGGIPGNLNRVLPKNVDALVYKNRWDTPPIFKLIQRLGPVDYEEMLKTFNMGLGLMAIAPLSEQKLMQKAADEAGETMHVVGKVVRGSGKVRVDFD